MDVEFIMFKTLFALFIVLFAQVSLAASYPTTRPVPISSKELTWHDAARNRDVPVKIYSPKEIASPVPVIVFSHGLGGSREGYSYFGEYMASLGYVVVHMTHIGTDSSVINSIGTARQDLAKTTLDPRSTLNRIQDVKFTLDQVEKANAKGGLFEGKLDLKNIGIAGHSYGSLTTMIAAGEKFVMPGGREISMPDPRIKAALAMSSPAPREEKNYAAAYKEIKIPVFHMTGTQDDSPIGDTSAAERRVPFDNTKNAEAWLLTLKDGDHKVFGGRVTMESRMNDREKAQHEIIKNFAAAFFDQHLKGSESAKKWLNESGKTYLGEGGKLEHKGE